jgi:hypothetical protein
MNATKTDYFTFGDEDLESGAGLVELEDPIGHSKEGEKAEEAALAYLPRPNDAGAWQGAQRSRGDSELQSSATRGLPAVLFKLGCALAAVGLLVAIGTHVLDGGGRGGPNAVAVKSSPLPRAVASPPAQQTKAARIPSESVPRAAARDKQVERKRSVTRRRAPRRRTPRRRQKSEARSHSDQGEPSEPAVPTEVEPAPATGSPIASEGAVEPITAEESTEPVSSEPAAGSPPSGGEAAQSQFGVESGAGG